MIMAYLKIMTCLWILSKNTITNLHVKVGVETGISLQRELVVVM
jgi:hypothetical protein